MMIMIKINNIIYYFLILLLLSILSLCKSNFNGPERSEIVFITGCSSGIGLATALYLANHPSKLFKVYASMRSTDYWKGKGQYHDKNSLETIECDVTSDDSVKKAIDYIIKKEGHISVVINNAGYGISGCLEQVSIEEAKKLFDVNVWGAVRVLQATLPHMRKLSKGYIINISSTSGIRGIPCFEYYTSSKFALEGFSDSMRYSLAHFNISVTNLNAGPIKTQFTDKFGNVDKGGKGTKEVEGHGAGYITLLNEHMIKNLNQRMASSEAQTPEDIAAVIANLIYLKFGAKSLTDVPFNIGSNSLSQKVIEEVRKNPTGWNGIYTAILEKTPVIDDVLHHEEL